MLAGCRASGASGRPRAGAILPEDDSPVRAVRVRGPASHRCGTGPRPRRAEAARARPGGRRLSEPFARLRL